MALNGCTCVWLVGREGQAAARRQFEPFREMLNQPSTRHSDGADCGFASVCAIRTRAMRVGLQQTRRTKSKRRTRKRLP